MNRTRSTSRPTQTLPLEELALTVLNQIPSAVLVVRAPSGQVLYSNEAVRTYLGHAAFNSASIDEYTEWYGRHIDGTPLRAEEYSAARVIRTGKSVQEIRYYHRPDGRTIQLFVQAQPLFDDQNKMRYVVVCFYDPLNLPAPDYAIHHGRVRLDAVIQRLLASFHATLRDRELLSETARLYVPSAMGQSIGMIVQSLLMQTVLYGTGPIRMRLVSQKDRIRFSIETGGEEFPFDDNSPQDAFIQRFLQNLVKFDLAGTLHIYKPTQDKWGRVTISFPYTSSEENDDTEGWT